MCLPGLLLHMGGEIIFDNLRKIFSVTPMTSDGTAPTAPWHSSLYIFGLFCLFPGVLSGWHHVQQGFAFVQKTHTRPLPTIRASGRGAQD